LRLNLVVLERISQQHIGIDRNHECRLLCRESASDIL
jgi:hypothetical protein